MSNLCLPVVINNSSILKTKVQGKGETFTMEDLRGKPRQ